MTMRYLNSFLNDYIARTIVTKEFIIYNYLYKVYMMQKSLCGLMHASKRRDVSQI